MSIVISRPEDDPALKTSSGSVIDCCNERLACRLRLYGFETLVVEGGRLGGSSFVGLSRRPVLSEGKREALEKGSCLDAMLGGADGGRVALGGFPDIGRVLFRGVYLGIGGGGVRS